VPNSDTFNRACAALADALDGPFRRDVVAAASRSRTLGHGLNQIGAAMRSHVWRAGDRTIDLADVLARLDQDTRHEGFHVLHDWDGKAARVTPNSIAVDMLEFTAAHLGNEPMNPAVLAMAIDYYFMYALALVAMRAWDTDEAGAALDRVTTLVGHLQGPHGSGQGFAQNAETLLLIATSHYEPQEHGYGLLLQRARALPHANRVAMALSHAQAMGGHLRFGFEVTYGKDLKAMRDDNGADYPWLNFALAGLLDEYARLLEAGERGVGFDRVVEGIINALTPDPDAFLGSPPAWLDAHQVDYVRVREGLDRHRAGLIAAFEPHRPLDRAYSPISLFFNFSLNVLKGTVADALLRGDAWTVSLNDLFTGVPRAELKNQAKVRLSQTLTTYARRNPDTIRGRLSPVIVYDPITARQYVGGAMRALKSA
jgi:hypothetical protein